MFNRLALLACALAPATMAIAPGSYSFSPAAYPDICVFASDNSPFASLVTVDCSSTVCSPTASSCQWDITVDGDVTNVFYNTPPQYGPVVEWADTFRGVTTQELVVEVAPGNVSTTNWLFTPFGDDTYEISNPLTGEVWTLTSDIATINIQPAATNTSGESFQRFIFTSI